MDLNNSEVIKHIQALSMRTCVIVEMHFFQPSAYSTLNFNLVHIQVYMQAVEQCQAHTTARSSATVGVKRLACRKVGMAHCWTRLNNNKGAAQIGLVTIKLSCF